MKSIRKSLFLIFMMFMIILVLGNVVINVSLIKEYYMRQTKKRMKSTSEEITKAYVENKGSLQDYIEMIDGTWGIWVRIADENYDLMYTSKPERNRSMHLSDWAIKAIDSGKKIIEKKGVYYSEKSKDENNIVRLFCITKILDGDKEVYIILTRSVKSIYENIDTANRLVEITALILFIIGSIFIFYFSKSITQPILDISDHAKEISKLNFSKRLNIKSKNEMGTLANTINEISDKLSVSIDGLKQDIDDRKALVRNMSHELKTPISAVKGYAEGLKYAVADTPEKMNKYCDVIIMECNKMDYLVKEMLELSIMERVDWQIQKESFKVSQLIESIQMCYEQQIKEQQITLEIQGNQEMIASGDYHLIERAAFNYVENAIRHTGIDGKVKITVEQEQGGFLFKVYNTGSIVLKEEMKSIWKVFYKTDKSRTRESNNYGVGLAIVKANITQHGGNVEVENKEEGVEFSFWIPE